MVAFPLASVEEVGWPEGIERRRCSVAQRIRLRNGTIQRIVRSGSGVGASIRLRNQAEPFPL